MIRLAATITLVAAAAAPPPYVGGSQHLVVHVPDGWTAAAPAPVQGGTRVVVAPPADLTRSIAIDIIPGVVTRPTTAIVDAMAEPFADLCAVPIGPHSALDLQNGSSFVGLRCARTKANGRGELRLIRAIAGTDALFVISRRWTYDAAAVPDGAPISRAEGAPAIADLTAAHLCPATVRDAACEMRPY